MNVIYLTRLTVITGLTFPPCVHNWDPPSNQTLMSTWAVSFLTVDPFSASIQYENKAACPEKASTSETTEFADEKKHHSTNRRWHYLWGSNEVLSANNDKVKSWQSLSMKQLTIPSSYYCLSCKTTSKRFFKVDTLWIELKSSDCYDWPSMQHTCQVYLQIVTGEFAYMQHVYLQVYPVFKMLVFFTGCM